ncbi:MAG: DUF983 domain-containing protein [Hyphomicrobiales bacterium]|nr:DUF983 domain-containing protein [Hyphomicrobiales bacterium]
MSRGARLKCPSCGKGRIFKSYLKVRETCSACREELHHHRADDAPPYFTVFIVGHIVVPAILSVEMALAPPLWMHFTAWIPLTLAMTLLLLPMTKGALVGLQWSLRMHGFNPNNESASDA